MIEEKLQINAQALKAGLYLVATPIGNLRDITLRALDVLAAADLVVCEDTRVSGKLLNAYGLKKKLLSYNDHSDAGQRKKIVKKITDGSSVALISDAGMPLISDPGYKLVRDCLEQGLYVTSLPGANALLSALQLSGIPSDQFSFLGFLPAKQATRQSLFKAWKLAPVTLIAYESPKRLIKSLQDIQSVLGNREVAVVREISKIYEESKQGLASDVLDDYQKEGAPKGEVVLVIAPPEKHAWNDQDIKRLLIQALKEHSTKKAANIVSKETGLSKTDLYAQALKLK